VTVPAKPEAFDAAKDRGRVLGFSRENLRAIPSDHEAERFVLGAVLLDHESLYRISHKLSPASFDHPRHQIIYEAFLALSDKHLAITSITLRDQLAEQGKLESVGGIAFIGQLMDVPTAAHVESHAEIVRKKALARNLIRTCEQVATRGYDPTQQIEELLEQAERDVLQIAMGHTEQSFSRIGEQLQETFDYIDRIQSGELAGARTGFEELDALTGGFGGGDLVILAARPSVGKTAFALNLACNHALRYSGCVAFFSLEMQKRELTLRLLLGEAHMDGQRLRNGMLSHSDMREMTSAASRLQEARLFFDDSMAVTVSDISAKARRLHRENQLSMIVIDYIQLIQGRTDIDRRHEQVADSSRALKILAKELNVPVIALSQLNRSVESRPDKKPILSDLRESGAIEQDADIVMFVHRPGLFDETIEDNVAELLIAKHRNGPTGTVRLQFERQCGRFNNLSGRNTPSPAEVGFGPPPRENNFEPPGSNRPSDADDLPW
jgi:replicative DNA helicase